MTIENKSFAEASQIKSSSTVYEGHTYAEASNTTKTNVLYKNSIQKASYNFSNSSFPILSNSQLLRKKNSNSFKFNSSQFPHVQSHNTHSYSSNGCFLTFQINLSQIFLISILLIPLVNKLPLFYLRPLKLILILCLLLNL